MFPSQKTYICFGIWFRIQFTHIDWYQARFVYYFSIQTPPPPLLPFHPFPTPQAISNNMKSASLTTASIDTKRGQFYTIEMFFGAQHFRITYQMVLVFLFSSRCSFWLYLNMVRLKDVQCEMKHMKKIKQKLHRRSHISFRFLDGKFNQSLHEFLILRQTMCGAKMRKI